MAKPDFSFEIVAELPPTRTTFEHILLSIAREHPDKWIKFNYQTKSAILQAIRKNRTPEQIKCWQVETRTLEPKEGRSYGETNAYVKYSLPVEKD